MTTTIKTVQKPSSIKLILQSLFFVFLSFTYPMAGLAMPPSDTMLEAEFCDVEGIQLDQLIAARPVSEAFEYHFRVTNLDLGYQDIVISKEPVFMFNQFSNTPFEGVTYDVDIKVNFGKSLSDWGKICRVTLSGESPDLPCLTDELIKSKMLKDPSYELALNDFIESTRTHVQSKKKSFKPKTKSLSGCVQSYNIPVAVHIVYDPAVSGAGALTYSDIQAAIQKLNDDFNGSSAPNNTCIEFCLAPIAPSGTSWSYSTPGSVGTATPGITRTANNISTYVTSNNHPASVIGFPTDEYLNIWVVENITFAAGFAYMPPGGAGSQDGIVIRSSHFTSSHATPAHEAGHFLGLLHPFGITGSSCSPLLSNGNPATSAYPAYPGVEEAWDFISDTPPQSQGTSYSGGCTPIPACPTYGNTMPTLFMDYSSQSCKDLFTQGQIDWMHSVLQTNGSRSNLVKMSNLLSTGVAGAGGCVSAGLTADFEFTSTKQVCENTGTIDMHAVASITPYSSWNFKFEDPNGVVTNYPNTISPSVPSLTGIGTFSVPGSWDVTLTVFDGTGGQISSTETFFVIPCDPISGSSYAHWYFGDEAALDFSSGAPTADPSNIQYAAYGCSVVSDPNTNALLFYVNDHTAINGQHQFMQNGSGLGGTPGMQSGTTIVPNPDPLLPNEYYIFHVAGSSGLKWSVVDMNLDGGLGGVDPLRKSQPAPGVNPPIAGFVSAVPHCNGRDYWILVHGVAAGFQDKMMAYLLTPSGLQNPVLSTTSLVSGFTGKISMDVSQDGDKLATTGYSTGTSVYDFDRYTGLVSNETQLVSPYPSSGCSFSPSGKVLYTAGGNKVYQYDLGSLNSCQSNVTFETFVMPSWVGNLSHSQLQLGPDDKVYLSHDNAPYISVINYPEKLMDVSDPNACGINPGGVLLTQGRRSKLGLPNIIDANPPVPDVEFTFCIENCNEVQFSNLGCGASYLWDFGHGGNTSTLQNPQYIYPSTQGTYIVTLTNYDGSGTLLGSVSESITIAGSPSPVILPAGSICSGPGPYTYRIDPDPNISYPGASFNWSITGGQIVSNTNGPDVIANWNASGGTLTLDLIDVNGCVHTASLHQVPTSAPTIATMVSTDVSCAGLANGQVDVTASGGMAPYTIELSQGLGSTVSTVGASASFSGLSGGTYTVTVIDANWCTVSGNVVIGEPAIALSATITAQTNVLCHGASTGEATVSGANGTPPYSYQWSSGGFSATETGLSQGTYHVTVTDANSCTTSINVIITEPTAALTATITAQTNVLCNGGSTGSATVSASGGTSPYTFGWSSSSGTSATESGLPAGTFTATITDANLCEVYVLATITEPPVSVDLGPDVNICPGQSVNLFACVLGFPNQHTYTWSPSVIGNNCNITVNPTTTTTYTVSVFDNNTGCVETDEVTVNVITLANTTVVAQGATLCEGYSSDVAVITIASTLTAGAQYVVEDSNGNLITTSASPHIEIPGLASGNYTFEVYQEVNGCQGPSTVVTVTVLGSSGQFAEHFYNPNGSSNDMEVMAVAHDDQDGSVYVTGWYDTDLKVKDIDQSGTVYGAYLGGAETIFIAKYDVCGELQWLHGYASNGSLGVTMPHDIVVGPNQNVYLTGQYKGRKVDFSGTASPGTLSPVSSEHFVNTFVMEVDFNGRSQWVVSATSEGSIGSGLTVDDNEMVYVTGRFFNGYVNFNPQGISSSGMEDYYVVALDAGSNGICSWVKALGVSGTVSTGGIHESIAVDGFDHVYVGASYNGQINPGGLPAINTTGALDNICLVRLDATSGVFLNITNIGAAASNDLLGDMVVDRQGSAYLTGSFTNSTNLGGGTLTTAAAQDVFVARYEPSGAFIWSEVSASTGGSAGAIGTGIGIDNAGDAYITGVFSGFDVTFDGTNTLNNTAAPLNFGFIAGYSALGNFDFAQIPTAQNPTASSLSPVDLTTTNNGTSYYAGQFVDGIDFHSGQPFGELNSYFEDGFLAKITHNGTMSQRLANRNSLEGSDFDKKPAFDVYPNPTSGSFTIEVEEFSEGAKIIVTNILGDSFYDIDITNKVTPVIMDDLAKGVYFVMVIEGGKREVKTILYTK